MTYNVIIQKAGKRITKHVYYVKNNVRIDINDENILKVKIKMESPLIGLSIKSCEIVLKEAIPIDGEIYVQIEASYGKSTATKTYGGFYSKEEPTFNASKKEYTHKTYDKILRSMVDYQPITMTYPCTVLSYFQQLVYQLGYTTNIISLPNGARTMSTDVYTGINLTYRDVLQDLAIANGVLLWLDDDEIKTASLGTVAITINDDILKNQNIDFGKHYGKINSIILSRSADSDSVYLRDESSIQTNGLCEFKISDSILMNFNDRSDYLPALLSQLDGVEYDIYDTELVGYGDVIPLQQVQFRTDNKTYLSYIFSYEITFTTGYKQAIYNEEPKQTVSDYKVMSDTDKKINQTYLIVDKQNQTIESVVTQTIDTGNPESTVNKISTLTQRVDSLESEISNVTGMVSTKDSTSGSITFTDDTNESEPITIKVYPTSESISYLYPHSNLYPSSTTYLKNRKIRFYNNTTNQVVYDYELPDDLLYYDSTHYDEFYLDLNSQTCQVIKKCKYNADGTIGLLSSEQINSYTYPLILLTEGKYTISLLGYNAGYILTSLMAKNIYTDQFYTKVETDSKISQTANNITLSVNQTLSNYSTTNQMNSAITLKANEINSTVSETYATKNALNTVDNDLQSSINNNVTTLSSRISQTAKDITLSVTNGSTSSGISIGITKEDGTTEQATGTIEMNGLVKFNDLSTSGSTTINGENITTGTLSASKITTGTLNGNNVTITNLNASNIKSGTLTSRAINNGNGTFSVSANGTIHAQSGTIGGWSLSSSKLYGTYNNTRYAIRPYGVDDETNGRSIGWGSLISSSDERLKNNIKNIEDKYNQFYDDLKPVSFKFNQGIDNGNLHFGFIAQDVLKSEKLVNENLSMIEQTDKYYNLYKQEIIALNTWQIQMLKEEVRLLKEEINKLKEKK